MDDYTANAICSDFNFLAHEGRTGMHWHVWGGPGIRYQNHAVYARYDKRYADKKFGSSEKMSKREAKKQAAAAKKARKQADAATMQSEKPDLTALKKSISEMDDATLRKETERLNNEANYMNAVMNNINKTKAYKDILDAPERAKQEAFNKRVSDVWNATSGVRKDLGMLARNAFNMALYDAIVKESGTDKANAIMNGLVKINNNNNKNNGGGNNKGGNGKASQDDPAIVKANAEKTRAETEMILQKARELQIKNNQSAYAFKQKKREDRAEKQNQRTMSELDFDKIKWLM